MSARRIATVLLLALLGPLTVATAHADTTDDRFLATLRSEGITDQVSNAQPIEAGHFVCVKLDNGTSANEVANDVLNSSSMPAYHAGFFVGASIDAYCPRHKAELPSS
ncbi:MAG: hypothetical protein QOD58_4593 [Mycobacterium sp.]|nr:hypothetical protein [Mycobacterium sp.]